LHLSTELQMLVILKSDHKPPNPYALFSVGSETLVG